MEEQGTPSRCANRLVISRKDSVINLCEIKYSLHPITISMQDDQGVQHKRTAFLAETGTRKTTHLTMITTKFDLTLESYNIYNTRINYQYKLKKNAWSYVLRVTCVTCSIQFNCRN